eukprot:TRINITY_DN1264_c5_g1_i1.p1 TRINITY_DN1264_c5_g1~~TRINITY_DN1264_c5_g1_i1.p1  ORF type:complete len:190 (+),score=62.55 TRINITY_DN1264_c5_g1_i1:65-634(+)
MLPETMSFEDLTHWRNPKASGIVFGGGVLAYILLVWVDFCFIKLSIFAFQCAVAIALGLSFTAHKIKRKEPEDLQNLIGGYISGITKVVEPLAVKVAVEFNKIATMDDKVHSMKFLVLSYVVSTIFSIISFTTIILLAWIGAFAWPKIYETNQGPIDDNFAKANAAFAEQIKKVPKLAEALGYNTKKSE